MTQVDPLWTALRRPSSVTSLSEAQWDLLIRLARLAKLLGRLEVLLREEQLLDDLPPRVRDHFLSARVKAEKHEATMRWEARQVRRALARIEGPVVLLKGAAYVMADLPPARGRLFSDIDVMVPKALLDATEQALLEHGWYTATVHAYDQRYYRRWMHELPPMMHLGRGTVLDLHHTILPETGRLHPDPKKLFADAISLSDGKHQTLSPHDMILHSAAHLFQDGSLAGGLRDLTDLDDLFRHFGAEPDFWEGLVPRAREMDLVRPLYYALCFTQQVLDTPIPEATTAAATEHGKPFWPVGPIMNALVLRALGSSDPDRNSLTAASVARWLLYVRSHWLRMPPLLLISHLTRKAFRSWHKDDKTEKADDEE